MQQDEPPPGDRAILLACSIRTLRRYWIEVRCRCQVQFLPLNAMATNPSVAGLNLADVVMRVRCQHCRDRPGVVALVGDPAAQASGRAGAPVGWRVVLAGRE